MPRSTVWPPTIYFHKATGLARVRIRGRDYYLGPFGSEEAQKNYVRLIAECKATGSAPAPRKGRSSLTVAEVAALFLAEAERDRGKDNRDLAAAARVAAVLVAVAGSQLASSFDPPSMEEVRNAMATGSWMNDEQRARMVKSGRPIGWSRNVVNRNVVRVGTIWRWAERRKLVPPGSYASLKTLPGLSATSRVARQTARVRPATYDELRAVRKKAPRVVAYLLTVQWWTGMRSGEVRTMKVGELDRSDPDMWVYRPGSHKTSHLGQTRAVPLGRVAMLITRRMAEGKTDDDCLFQPKQLRRSKCYTRYSYAKAVRRAADAAGLPGWHAYQLRHGAKQRITRQFGLDTARAVLGQKSIGTTNGYGDALDLEAASEAMRHRG